MNVRERKMSRCKVTIYAEYINDGKLCTIFFVYKFFPTIVCFIIYKLINDGLFVVYNWEISLINHLFLFNL